MQQGSLTKVVPAPQSDLGLAVDQNFERTPHDQIETIALLALTNHFCATRNVLRLHCPRHFKDARGWQLAPQRNGSQRRERFAVAQLSSPSA